MVWHWLQPEGQILPFVLSWEVGRIWKTMLWPWRRFKEIKMNHHRLPGNTRRSLNGLLLYLEWEEREWEETTAGGGDTAGERDTAAWQRLTTTGKQQTQRDVNLCWFPVGVLREMFFLELPPWRFPNQLVSDSSLHPMQCHLHKNVENVTNYSQVSKRALNYEAARAVCYTKCLQPAGPRNTNCCPRLEGPEGSRDIWSQVQTLRQGFGGISGTSCYMLDPGTWDLSWILSCFLMLH